MGDRYLCQHCGFEAPLERHLSACPMCGGPLEIVVEVDSSKPVGNGVWRYAPYLPSLDVRVTRGEGGTPLIKAERLGEVWGFSSLYLKDETRNPTGSFIDRGVALAISAARSYGFSAVFCYGEGDLGASAAAYAAAAGVRCRYEPRGPVDSLKLLQIALYGAQITQGGSETRGGEYRLWPGDPFLLEGYKTLALEVVEDLNGAPSAVVVQVGHGSLAYGLWRGFKLAVELGMVEREPRFYAAQEDVCSPVVKAILGERASISLRALSGLSSELLVENPVRLREVVTVVRESGGSGVSVSGSEIAEALRQLACREGILIAPSAAVGLAALRRLRDEGEIDSSEEVLVVATGSGVRSFKALMRALGRVGVRRFRSRTKLAILGLLKRGDAHPYLIWRSLLTMGFSLTKQAVYKHLRELERDGYVAVRNMGRKKVYRITDKGLALLKQGGRRVS